MSIKGTLVIWNGPSWDFVIIWFELSIYFETSTILFRRNFQKHSVKKKQHFHSNFTQVCSWWPDWQYVISFFNASFVQRDHNVLITRINRVSWWCHQMETFSALLALCAGNSPVTGEFPSQRPVTRSFDVFFDLRLNKRLSKQSHWSWRHCNVYSFQVSKECVPCEEDEEESAAHPTSRDLRGAGWAWERARGHRVCWESGKYSDSLRGLYGTLSKQLYKFRGSWSQIH